MPYSTPELLCVGSAQNLVLGLDSFPANNCVEDGVTGFSIEVELW